MKLKEEDKAGLYITISVHLVVVIILLIFQISKSIKKSEEFLLDFTAYEESERVKAEQRAVAAQEAFDAEINRRIDALLSGKGKESFKNIATDRNAHLKDDRGTNADDLYREHERLAKQLRDGVQVDESDDGYASAPGKEEEKTVEYKGPSVLSYNLPGRKASRLRNPAYGCFEGGMVTVLIAVDNAGNVVKAKVQDATSSPDNCMREKALEAALKSRFSANPKAPSPQMGDIIYQFIHQ